MKDFCLCNKTESEELIKDFIVKTRSRRKSNFVRHDGAKEFASDSLKSFYAQCGIEQ